MFGTVARRFTPRTAARSISQKLAEPTAWSASPTVITTLSNGVRVATQEAPSEVSSVGVFLNAGTRNETKETAGANYLVEKLALSGTQKRPKDKLIAEVEGMGATLDVTTGREQSSYQMSVLNGDLKKGVDILADLVTVGGIGNFDKEKANLIRSMEDTDASTRAVLDDRLHMCAFRDTALGFSGIGPYEGIEGMTQAQLASFMADSYTAENMVLAAVGPTPHGDVVKAAEAALGGVKAGKPGPPAEKPYFCGADLIYRNDEMGPTAYVAMGYEAVPWKSPDAITFEVMKAIIGKYKKNQGLVPGKISGNRVANAVANKMQVGCAEEFEAFNCMYKDTGIFGFYVACDEVAVEHAVGELQFGVNMLFSGVTDEEVERAKRELKKDLFGTDGSTSYACTEMGKQVLAYGRGIPPAEMILRIDAIDAEEVKRLAWKHCNDAEIAITGLGPLHGLPHYMELRMRTSLYRY
eukprot:gnl/TRDRNA2_/TRDRNA2_175088_c3_seq17.p1 gnl/TRDRNA2_/TRDRNA2_175088_c3~~gnl/TRDRNA2_/TRDRNA2_175088_c3_seq17.p1  ORF type:complete len:467 (+),score=127.76 gnl/TRDRNA2_/TRDRNA2_175088_c3_seq17:84-1484(+)